MSTCISLPFCVTIEGETYLLLILNTLLNAGRFDFNTHHYHRKLKGRKGSAVIHGYYVSREIKQISFTTDFDHLHLHLLFTRRL